MTNVKEYKSKLEDLLTYIKNNQEMISTKSVDDALVVKGMVDTVTDYVNLFETIINTETPNETLVAAHVLMAEKLLYLLPLEVESILGDGASMSEAFKFLLTNKLRIVTTPEKMDSVARKEAKRIKTTLMDISTLIVNTPLSDKETLADCLVDLELLVERANLLNK